MLTTIPWMKYGRQERVRRERPIKIVRASEKQWMPPENNRPALQDDKTHRFARCERCYKFKKIHLDGLCVGCSRRS